MSLLHPDSVQSHRHLATLRIFTVLSLAIPIVSLATVSRRSSRLFVVRLSSPHPISSYILAIDMLDIVTPLVYCYSTPPFRHDMIPSPVLEICM